MAPIIPTRSSLLTPARIVIATALLALTSGSYLAWHSPLAAAEPAQATRIDNSVDCLVAQADDFSGRLEAIGGVDVHSRVAGRIESIHFVPGALVARGETLFVIDARPFEAELARAQATLAAAHARAAQTDSDLARAARRLDGDDSEGARREFHARQRAQQKARTALRTAQEAADLARLNLDATRITAPVSGRVGRTEVGIGHLVTARPALTSIVSLSPIYALSAAERDLLS